MELTRRELLAVAAGAAGLVAAGSLEARAAGKEATVTLQVTGMM